MSMAVKRLLCLVTLSMLAVAVHADNLDLAVNKFHEPDKTEGFWNVGIPIDYVITIKNVGSAGNAHVSVLDKLPEGFVVTNIKCEAAFGAACPSTPLVPPDFGQFSMPANDSNITLRIGGYYKTAGAKDNEAVAGAKDDQGNPVPAGANTKGKDQLQIPLAPVPVNIDVDKTVAEIDTVFDPKAKLHYTIKVWNNSQIPIYLGGIMTVSDQMWNASSIKIAWTASGFKCQASQNTMCPDLFTGSVTGTIDPNQAVETLQFPFDKPGSDKANDFGFMDAGGSFTIEFDVELETPNPCSNGAVKFRNQARLYFSSGQLVGDKNGNNTSKLLESTITGLPTTCPPPPPGPSPKKTQEPLTGSTVWAPGSVTYTVAVNNPRDTAMIDVALNDTIFKGNGTPPFTAVITDGPKCVQPSACTSLDKLMKQTVSATADGVEYPLWSAVLPLLPPKQTALIRYTVVYTPDCETDKAPNLIRNYIRAAVTDATPTGPKTTSNRDYVDTKPEEAAVCAQWLISKIPEKPAFSKFGDTLEYTVEYRNDSDQTRVMGTVRDHASIRSDQKSYGPVELEYSFTCSTAGIKNGPPASQSASKTIGHQDKGWYGATIIDAQKVEFAAKTSLTCHVKIKLVQPTGPACQGKGTAKFINAVLMDLSEKYSPPPLAQPQFYAETEADLPLCRKAIVTKVAVIVPPAKSAEYGPGGLVTYKITATNTGIDDLAGLTVKDVIQAPLTGVSASPCMPLPTACSSPPALVNNVVEVKYAPLKAGQGVTFDLVVKAPQAGGSYPNFVKGTFAEGGKWYFQGDVARLEQEENITVLTPKLAKTFAPASIGPTSTSTLTFDITNTASDPPQSGMSFTDSLPAGLVISGTPTNTCGGTVTVSADGRSLSLGNGSLATGTHTCRITATVSALGVCGIYKNTKANFSNVSNVDVSTVDKSLEVTGCPIGLVVRKNVEGAPAGFKAQFNFSLTCTSPSGPYTKSFTIAWPAPGLTTINDIPAGSQCKVTEGAMPAAPQGLAWAAPVYTPAGGVVTLGDKTAEVAVLNRLEERDECIRVIVSEVSCEVDKNGKPTGGYIWKFRFENLTGRPISHLYITDLPKPVAAVPVDYIAFVPPVTKFSPVVQVTLKNATPGPLSFTVSLQDQGFECCTMPIRIELPPCDCAQVVSESRPSCFYPFFTTPPPYLYSFKLQNLSSLPVDHVFVAPVSPLDHVTPVASAAVKVGKSVHPIATLAPGASMSVPITVAIDGTQAKGGQEICLALTLRSTDPDNCCCTIVRCFKLPDCGIDLDDYDWFDGTDFTWIHPGFRLDGIGSTGEDGVSIALHDARAAELAWLPLDEAGPLPDGAYFEIRAAGNEGEKQGSIRVTKAGERDYRITASDADRQAYTVEVFRDGEVVDAESGVRGDLHGNVWPSGGGAEIVPAGEGETLAFTLSGGEPVSWQLPDGTSITGERLRLTPEDGGAGEVSLQRLELRLANIPSIEVTGTSIFHDCNRNGTPDAEDIATGVSEDANGDGRPDECEGATDVNVSLNTGFDQVAGAPLPFGELPDGTDDDEWRIVAPGADRPAKVVIGPFWNNALPDTRWISSDPNSGVSIPNAPGLVFQRCFCIAETADAIELDLQLRADNEATVLLNGRHIASGGVFNDANPLRISLDGRAGDGVFVAGENCLIVDVRDDGVVGGLTLAGTVKAQRGACTR